jgi:hypothetical protein
MLTSQRLFQEPLRGPSKLPLVSFCTIIIRGSTLLLVATTGPPCHKSETAAGCFTAFTDSSLLPKFPHLGIPIQTAALVFAASLRRWSVFPGTVAV